MGFVQCRNVKQYTYVDNCFKLISTPINTIGKDDEYRLTGGSLKTLDIFDLKKIENDIENETEKEFEKLKFLSNYCDKDFIISISLHYDYFNNEGKEKVESKKVYSLVELFYHGISIDYLIYSSNIKQRIEEVKEQLQYDYFDFNDTIDYKGDLPLIFTDHAAVVLAHEFLGHMFEIDNFYFNNYREMITDVESLKLTVFDNPLIMDSSAYYKFDDAGIAARVTKILDKGNFTGKLIGGDIDKMIVNSNLRRDTYSSKLQPRMSNFIVKSECSEKKPRQYIQVIKLSKCYVDHKNKRIKLNVDLALLRDNSMNLYRIKPFALELSIQDLLKKIQPMECQNFLRPLQCYKKGQIIECGGVSCDWLLLNKG